MLSRLTARLLAGARIQVAEARQLATSVGVANVRFEVADAQVHPFGTRVFDVVLSNFGVMFFEDPAAAFGNLRKALRCGGRLAFVCWRTRAENPVFTTGFADAAAVLRLREVPGPHARRGLAGHCASCMNRPFARCIRAGSERAN
jgi:SAM-dependent methyltransferase